MMTSSARLGSAAPRMSNLGRLAVMVPRVHLHVDRDAEALHQTRTFSEAALVFPLETTIVGLHVGDHETRLDRASFAVLPARTTHRLELPAFGGLDRGDGGARRGGVHCGDSRVSALRRCAPAGRGPVGRAGSAAHPVGRRARAALRVRTRGLRAPGEQGGAVPRGRADQGDVLPCQRAARPSHAELGAVRGQTRSPRRPGRGFEEHLFEPFHIAELVKHCQASESTVLRAFRGELGVAPRAYVRRRRLEEAMQFLEAGRYAVTEVAMRVGYDNPSAFAAAFRAQFGVAPSSVKPTLQGATRLPAHGMPPVRRRRHRS